MGQKCWKENFKTFLEFRVRLAKWRLAAVVPFKVRLVKRRLATVVPFFFPSTCKAMNLLEIAFGGMMRNTPFLASLPSVGIVKLFSHFEKSYVQ